MAKFLIKPVAIAAILITGTAPGFAQSGNTALMERQIASLQARVEALEDRLRVLEASPPQQLSRSLTEQKQDLDEALDLGEFAFRRFFDMMRELEAEANRDRPAE